MYPLNIIIIIIFTQDILHGASFALNSFIGHTFQVRELPAKKTGVCAGEDETCRVDHFTVNANQDQGEFSLFICCVVFDKVWCILSVHYRVFVFIKVGYEGERESCDYFYLFHPFNNNSMYISIITPQK